MSKEIAQPTAEMIVFAQEYALWTISVGQKYINALSPQFTTENSMNIFIEKYYLKDWLKKIKKEATNEI